MFKRSSQIVLPAVIMAAGLPLAGCSLTQRLTGHGGKPAPTVATSVADPTPGGASSAASGAAPAAGVEPDAEPEREHSEGLPAKLVELVHEAYGADPDRPGTEIGPRNHYFETFRVAAAAFDVGWSAFEKRSTIVTAAVSRAATLEKDNKLAEARAALEEVITPVTIDAEGKIDPRARQPLDPRDAEMPAVDAWIRVVAAIGDRKALVEAGRLLWVRRKPRDKDTERWFWLSAADDDSMRMLVSQNTPGIRQEVWKIWDEAAKVRGASPFDTEGQRLASMHFNSLSRFGLAWTVPDVEKGKPGDWIMIRVEPVQLGERDVKHSSTEQWRVPKRCWDTDKISWWDGNGKPVYETACEYTYHQRPITLDAKLKDGAPAWAKGRERLLVVGKITGPGPAWKLVDAFIPDLRFSETGFLF